MEKCNIGQLSAWRNTSITAEQLTRSVTVCWTQFNGFPVRHFTLSPFCISAHKKKKCHEGSTKGIKMGSHKRRHFKRSATAICKLLFLKSSKLYVTEWIHFRVFSAKRPSPQVMHPVMFQVTLWLMQITRMSFKKTHSLDFLLYPRT
jgi:hypothetical protein